MIGIGINKNVVLHKAAITDKGWLALDFIEVKVLTTKKSIFEEANSSEVSTDSKATTINLFQMKKPDGPRNEGKTDDELIEMISTDMSKLKNQLTQLLLIWMPAADIQWDVYKGTGVDKDNYRELLMKNSTLETISHNYFTQFINMISPFIGKIENALRVKLVRQSRDKAFATIPGKFLDENPWCEPMDIPEDKSRVKFTKWEIDYGFDSSAPVSKSDTDTKEDVENSPEAKRSAFGSR